MITEKDFIDKMVEIAKDGYEYMDQLQCIFFYMERILQYR